MSVVAREVRLARRPDGPMRADDFRIVETPLDPLRDGEVLVRNEAMSLDPYMRLSLTAQPGFHALTQPGDVMFGGAVGVVEESRDPALPEGTRVVGDRGWRSHFTAATGELQPVDADVPGHWHLGLLGLTGVSAHLGVETVLRPGPGETVFVTGAAGAVGSVACQLAKARGARVLGSAGSPEKARWLRDEAGVDAVLDHRREDVAAFLAREAPDGLNCYFDNVGGPILEAALAAMVPYGRVGLCGAMALYDGGVDYRSGPSNFFAVIEKSLTVTGFNSYLVPPAGQAAIVARLRDAAAAGAIRPCETIVEGLDRAPQAFVAMFDGAHLGKLIVTL